MADSFSPSIRFHVLRDKALDFGVPEPGQFSKSDARQEWLLSRRVIVHPCFADAEPRGDLG